MRPPLKARQICADTSSVKKTNPFSAAAVQTDTVATMDDLMVDPGRCQGAVLFHENRRVMCFPAGRPAILCHSRAKEVATVKLYLPLGSAN